MSQKVDLYDSAYGNYVSDTYRQVRIETYGEDFGQTSWVTTEESNEIPQLLDLGPNSFALEVGCGLGGYALHLAAKVGCRLVGLDINALCQTGIGLLGRVPTREIPWILQRVESGTIQAPVVIQPPG